MRQSGNSTALFAFALSTGLFSLQRVGLAQARDGWNLQWEDTFSGSSIDSSRWSVLTRQDSYNNEKQYYTPDAVTESGGNLNITATNVPLGTKAYRSGLVQTIAQQTFGRWDITASIPTGQGMWPALWLLPQNVSWPTGGEIDIMENKGSTPGTVQSSYHWGTSPSTLATVTQTFGYSVNGTPVSFQNSFHDYSVEWDPHRIRYYVDNVPIYTFYNATAISSTPMALIMNLAVGGDYGGDPNGSTVFPQTMKVDDVKQYQRDASARPNLLNRSFEATSGDLFQEWDEYSNGTNVGVDEVPSNARTGNNALKLFGRFNGTANTSGLFQEIPTTVGQIVQFDEWAKNLPNDLLAGANLGRMKIQFIDAAGNVLSTGSLTTTTSSSSTMYKQYFLSKAAPINSVYARAVIEMSQTNNSGGAFDVDDVNFQVVGTTLTGDIDLNGKLGTPDLDLMLHSLSDVNIGLDFNGDGVVNRADVTTTLNRNFHTTDGDTNLDGKVNYADLLDYFQHAGLNSGTWATGDFTGDGYVDAADLAYLQSNYGFGVGADGARLDTDFAYALTVVPEPTTTAVTLLAFGLVGRRRRAR